jgi:hypothetical protein
MLKHAFLSIFAVLLAFQSWAMAETIQQEYQDAYLTEKQFGWVYRNLQQYQEQIVTTKYFEALYNNMPTNIGITFDENPAPFMANVESDYFDEGLKTWVRVSGMGTLVTINGNLALLSATHVTQGQRLRIRDTNGVVIPMIPSQRLANVDDDIELILLKDSRKSTFSYDEKMKVFRTDFVNLQNLWNSMGDKVHSYMPFHDLLDKYLRVRVSNKEHVALSSLKIAREKLPDAQDPILLEREGGRALALELLKAGPEVDKAAKYWDEDGTVNRLYLGKGLVSGGTNLPPGISGAPLIRQVPMAAVYKQGLFNMQIRGVVLSQHRVEQKTFFADDSAIRDLVEKFKTGQKGYVTSTRWRMYNGQTFRDYGQGVLEMNPVKTPSASFVRQDSGNAVSIDSGNAVSIDSGATGIIVPTQSTGQKIIGRVLQNGTNKIPVIEDTRLSQFMQTSGYKTAAEISTNSDLFPLIQIKSQYANPFDMNEFADVCIYSLDVQGMKVTIYRNNIEKDLSQWDVMMSVQLSRDKLARGMVKDNLIQTHEDRLLDLHGMFTVDLYSQPSWMTLDRLLGPSVLYLPDTDYTYNDSTSFGTKDRRVNPREKLNCYKSNEELIKASQDFRTREEQLFRKAGK